MYEGQQVGEGRRVGIGILEQIDVLHVLQGLGLCFVVEEVI